MVKRGFEIERKFLAGAVSFDLSVFKNYEIAQAYISVDPVIRVRRAGDEYYLTIKSPEEQMIKEYEISLSKEQYNSLWKKTDEGSVIKTRYIIPLFNGLNAEYDVYGGHLTGLYTVEVEFGSVDEAMTFAPPDWFGKEVTNDKRYSNAMLSRQNTKKSFKTEKS